MFKNKWLNRVMVSVWVVAALLVSLTVLDATTYKPGVSRQQYNGISWGSYSYTWAAAGDTMISNITISPNVVHDVTIGTVIIRTQIAANTAANPALAARWEHSIDGVSWQSFTLGTDSTTWACSTWDSSGNVSHYGETWHVAAVPITQATHYGWWPYNRVKLYGTSSNTLGVKAKVDFIEQ
jgi:hypothetical protein